MPAKVRTPYMRDFKMPAQCVACGATPAFGATKIVTHTDNSGRKVTKTAIEFPLCGECYLVSQIKTGEGRVQGLTALVVIVLIIVSISLSGENKTPFIIGLVLSIVCLGLATFWIIRNNKKLYTKEQWGRKTQLSLCVSLNKIEKPWMGNDKGLIVFDFWDSTFADQFAKLNDGIMS